MRSCAALLIANLVLFAGCTETSLTTEPSGSSAAVTIAALTAQPVSTLSCGFPSGAGAADALTDLKTDRLSFTFSNPHGIDLSGAVVQRVGANDVLGTLATCVSDPCRASSETRSGSAACLESGSPTASSGTVVLHTVQYFRPSERYVLQLRTRPSGDPGISSNVLETTVVRVADVPSNQIAVAGLQLFKFIFPNRWGLFPTIFSYRPQIGSSSGYTLEVQVALYHPDGRLFYVKREASDYTSFDILTLRQTQAVADTNVGPPWRAVVRLRQTAGTSVGPTATVFSCNSELPQINESACTTDELPPPRAAVVAEHMREFTLQ